MNGYRVAAERRLRASELETELARAQLRALQMQLRPHFLFNALHTVAALVRAGESRMAVRTLSELGEFLRWLLEQDDAQLVPLHRELDLLDRYLRIEQIRFQDRLTTQVDVEPRALEALVPSLILQPLVENAVRHGLAERRPAGAHRRHRARRGPDALHRGAGQRRRARPPPNARASVWGTPAPGWSASTGLTTSSSSVPPSEGGAVAQLRIPFRPAERS